MADLEKEIFSKLVIRNQQAMELAQQQDRALISEMALQLRKLSSEMTQLKVLFQQQQLSYHQALGALGRGPTSR